jgi:hypothetical protein
MEYSKGGYLMSRLSKEELNSLPETMKYGSLIRKQNMSKEDMTILLHKLFSYNNDMLLIRNILESDDKMIEFLDILAGMTLKLPTHALILKTIHEIEIWNILKRKGFTQENIKNLSSSYKISVSKIRLIYEEYESKFGSVEDEEK